MKKTYKFLVLIIALFFGYILNASATSTCSDTTLSSFNSSTSNVPASDQNLACGYEQSSSQRGRRHSYVEIYRTNTTTYGDSYFVYKVTEGGGSTEYKMLLCTTNYDGNTTTYTESYDGEMRPYHSFDSATTPYDYYPMLAGADSYNSVFYDFIHGHTSDAHPKGICPEYAGFRTSTYSDENYPYEEFVYQTEGVSNDNDHQSSLTLFNEYSEGDFYGDVTSQMYRLSFHDSEHAGYEYTINEGGGTSYGETTDVVVLPPTVKVTKITEPDTIYEYYESNPCKTAGVLKTLRIVRTVIDIAKVVAPLIIIIVASIKFGKAAIGGDQNALQDASKYFIKKLILSVVIFLVPTSVNVITDLVYESPNINDKSARFGYCVTCLSGTKSTCDSYIDAIENNQDPDEVQQIIDDINDYSDPRCEDVVYNGYAEQAANACGGNTSGACYQAAMSDTTARQRAVRKCNCKDMNYNGVNAYAEEQCKDNPVATREVCLNDVRSSAQTQFRTDCENGIEH